MNELLLEMLFDPEVSPRVSAPMKEAIIDIFVRTAADDEVRLMRAGARGVIDDLFNLSKKILRLSTSPTEQNIIAQNDIEKINLCKTALVAIKISAKTSFDLIDEELMRNVKMVTKSKAVGREAEEALQAMIAERPALAAQVFPTFGLS